MSAFNILVTTCYCSECRKEYIGNFQFKFGDCWLYKYYLDEKIRWGGNDIGFPNISEVKVYGILDNVECLVCHQNNRNVEFDLIIRQDVIKQIQPMDNYQDYIEKEGDYKIIII